MTPDVVVSQLERILASETFATAGRHSRLLRYVVEKTLAGRGDELKEYVLGTEVFDRPESYDPRIDSIVRVEARRLRNRLEEYYATVGAGDPVVISVPRGSYVPVFSERRSDTNRPAPNPVAWTRPLRSYAALTLTLAAIAALVATLALNVGRDPTAEASAKPSVAVLPFEFYTTSEQDAKLAAYVTDSLTTSLARIDTVSVASRTSAAQYTGEFRSVVEIAKALNVDFVIESTAKIEGDHLNLMIRLVDGVRDRKVWVGEYDTTVRDVPVIARRIAAEAAAAAHNVSPRN